MLAALGRGHRQIEQHLAVGQARGELAVHIDRASQLAQCLCHVAFVQREQAQRVIRIGQATRVLVLREDPPRGLVAVARRLDLAAALEARGPTQLAARGVHRQIQRPEAIGRRLQQVGRGAVLGEGVLHLGQAELGVGDEALLVTRGGALRQRAEALGGLLEAAEFEAQAPQLEQDLALGRVTSRRRPLVGVRLEGGRVSRDRLVLVAFGARSARGHQPIGERLGELFGRLPMRRELEGALVAIGQGLDRLRDDRVQLLHRAWAADLGQDELAQHPGIKAQLAAAFVLVHAARGDERLERALDGVQYVTALAALERLLEHADVDVHAEQRRVPHDRLDVLRIEAGRAALELVGRHQQHPFGAIDQRRRQVGEHDTLPDRVPRARHPEVLGVLLDGLDELGRVRRIATREVGQIRRQVPEAAADRLRQLEELRAFEALQADELVCVRVDRAAPADELEHAAQHLMAADVAGVHARDDRDLGRRLRQRRSEELEEAQRHRIGVVQ